jgi:hypothetical protein
MYGEYFTYEDEVKMPRIEDIVIDTSGKVITATVKLSDAPNLLEILIGNWKRKSYSRTYHRTSLECGKWDHRYSARKPVWIDIKTGEDANHQVHDRLENLMLLNGETNVLLYRSVSVQ